MGGFRIQVSSALVNTLSLCEVELTDLQASICRLQETTISSLPPVVQLALVSQYPLGYGKRADVLTRCLRLGARVPCQNREPLAGFKRYTSEHYLGLDELDIPTPADPKSLF